MRPRTRTITGIGVALLLLPAQLGCHEASPQAAAAPDTEADRQAVLEAHRELTEAFSRADVNAFVLLLDKSDDLVLFHPRLEARWVGSAEAQHNLSRMFEHVGPSSWLDVELRANVDHDTAWLTYDVVIESAGIAEPFTGRGTEIWVRRTPGWRLAHAHWSANPVFERGQQP